MKFSHDFAVESSDIDEQKHVNNVAFVRWIQEVAAAHWRFAATAEQQSKFGWIVVRHEIDYKKPAFENESITAETWVGEWKGVTCERFTEITRAADLLVKSKTVWCLVDKMTMKPTRISREMRELF